MQDNNITIDKNESISKTFWRFAIPSVAAMVVNGLYQVIDGIFVGHYIGFQGLAGINMAWPILGSVMGLGVLIGMGGGSVMSIFRGEQDHNGTRTSVSTALALVVAFGALAMAFLHYFGLPLLHLQGATGEPLRMASEYLSVFSLGAMFTIGAGALPMLVRNDDSPKLSTTLTIIGAVTNIVLDYLMIGVMDMGLRGAAIATVLSQFTVVALAVIYFLSPYAQTRLSFNVSVNVAARTISLGASSLLMFMYFSFVAAVHNRLLMAYGSEVHVGAYAIIGYIATMYYLISEGIAGGLQPPVSYYFGAKQFSRIEATVKLAFKVIVLSGIATVVVINAFPTTIVNAFSQGDQTLLHVAAEGMRLHLFAVFLDGFLFLASVYFMAVGNGGKALMVSAGNMLIQVPFLLILPKLFGIDGVWMSVPLSNIALTAVVAPILWNDLKQLLQSDERQTPIEA
uniref:MATE family efflux transporter n=1 Tax=Thaumasiovibrio occultus TaxID=1891184 RepID=UPI000B35F363|nr:MATE family efflux transporter [Thaumasiovibrio occultus]